MLTGIDMNNAAGLVARIQKIDWRCVDARVRFVLLHEINSAVCALREGCGLPPIDDPLPPKLNVFFTIKNQLFPPAKVGREGFHQSGR